jgi:hypothetical protein
MRGDKECLRNFGKENFWKPRRVKQDNININIREVDLEDVKQLRIVFNERFSLLKVSKLALLFCQNI